MNQINRYQITAQLGHGGMAVVYRAYDPQFKREVAIKVMATHFLHDPQFRQRFQREAQVIARLQHPAIVPVYDFGEQNGQPYLVMALMSGGSLADRLQGGTMSLAEASDFLERIAPALDLAHQNGIVHRDLKPDNILFDQQDNPYLADFGIAKLLQQTSMGLSQTGLVIGTPFYMSPEQARGEKGIDGQSDIYSLGAILFELLTGQRPYDADTPAGFIYKHIHEPVPNIHTIQPNLPLGGQAVIEKAMAKNRDERYATAREMAAALKAVAEGNVSFGQSNVQTIAEQSKSTVPTRGWWQQWPVWAGVAALLVVAITAAALMMGGGGGDGGEDKAESSPLPAGSELVSKMSEAVNGTNSANFSADFRMVGIYDSFIGQFQFWGERPDKTRFEITSDDESLNGMVFVTNGDKEWTYSPHNKLVLVSDKNQFKTLLNQQPELDVMVYLAEKLEEQGVETTQVQTLGTETVNGRETYKVEAKYNDPELEDLRITYYIDQETSFPQQADIQIQIGHDGIVVAGIVQAKGEISTGGSIHAAIFTFTPPDDPEVEVLDLAD